MSDSADPIRAAFRLNLEQQRKQAKELLKAAWAGDAAALQRFAASVPDAVARRAQGTLKLADAQFAVARELRFANWPALKAHIEALDAARNSIQLAAAAPDTGVATLHLRCGSDIRTTLQYAGFQGDFLEMSYPYCYGPVTDGLDHLQLEARFIMSADSEQEEAVAYQKALTARESEERSLAASASRYARVVLWMEHDCYDQLVLVRTLAHYAQHGRPPGLELIDIDYFPGRTGAGNPVHFIGLGLLPAEALRLLWKRRRPVTGEQLTIATDIWNALLRDDPRLLAKLMRSGCAALPHAATALRRLLQELPSIDDGLSLTERLCLELLAAQSLPFNQLLGQMTHVRDPLFFNTDLRLSLIIRDMQCLADPAVHVTPAPGQWQDIVTITETGRAVLRGERDWMSLRPPPRWVGGVQVQAGQPHWRWDNCTDEPVRRD
jgi:hypothetical protein